MTCYFILALNACLAFSQVTGIDTSNSNVGYSPSLFYYVVIYRTSLGLPEYIIDTLNSRALTATDLQKDNPDFNLSSYERRIVKSFLTEDQYNNLLVLKNKPVAKEITSRVWREMLKQQLVTDPGDTALIGRINAHLQTVLITREYFADNLDEQSKYLNMLDKKAPSALYKYFHHGYSKPVVRNPERAEFIW